MSRSSSTDWKRAEPLPTRRLLAAELPAVALVLLGLLGTLALLIAAYRRPAVALKPAPKSPPILARKQTKPKPAPIPQVQPKPVATPQPKPAAVEIAAEDPSAEESARLADLAAKERARAQAADERTEALERARKRALTAIDRRKKREYAVRKQAEAIAATADRLLEEAERFAVERDVLRQEIQATKTSLAKRNAKTSYAIMPYRGANGTWRRPIPLECGAAGVILQPTGPAFSLADLKNASFLGINPLSTAVARAVVNVQGSRTPDGRPSVPYIVFIIRPNGIPAYYAARARLQQIPIAFGYELVDQDVEVDFPDPANPTDWDDGPPPKAFQEPTTLADTVGSGSARSGGVGFGPFQAGVGNVGNDQNGVRSPEGLAAGSRPRFPTGSAPRSAQGRPGFGSGPSTRGFDPRGGSFPPNLNVPDGRTLAALAQGADPNGLSPPAPGRIPLALDGADGESVRDDLPPLPEPSPGGFRNRRSERQAGPGQRETISNGSFAGRRDEQDAADASKKPRRGFGRWLRADARRNLQAASALGGDSTEPRAFEPAPSGFETGRGNAGSPPRNLASNPTDHSSPAVEAAPDPIAPGSLPSERTGLDRPSEGSSRRFGGTSAASSDSNASIANRAAGSGSSFQPRLNLGSTSSPGANAPPGMLSSIGLNPGGQAGEAGSSSAEKTRQPTARDFEVVVVCDREGVLVQPGMTRLELRRLRGNGSELERRLRAVVLAKKRALPHVDPQPSVRFLIEPGGQEAYWEARRQTLVSGLNWPVTVQVAEAAVSGARGRMKR